MSSSHQPSLGTYHLTSQAGETLVDGLLTCDLRCKLLCKLHRFSWIWSDSSSVPIWMLLIPHTDVVNKKHLFKSGESELPLFLQYWSGEEHHCMLVFLHLLSASLWNAKLHMLTSYCWPSKVYSIPMSVTSERICVCCLAYLWTYIHGWI